VLRREGLYSSHVVEWRRARDVGALAGLTKPRGRPARDRQQERITELEAEKRRLEQDLACFVWASTCCWWSPSRSSKTTQLGHGEKTRR